jgi:multicomponent Na+:H+ antiporter subunit C
VAVIAAASVGLLVAVAAYLLLRRSLIKLVIGLAVLGHAVNVIVLVAGDPIPGREPIVREGATVLEAPYSDPLPPALVLTAIVIGFGLLAYTIVLLKKAYQILGTDDLDEITRGDAGKGGG